MSLDGKQVKNKANPTGTGKYLNESGEYVLAPKILVCKAGYWDYRTVLENTNNQIISSDLIPANTFTAINDFFEIRTTIARYGTSTISGTIRIYVNSVNSLTGAQLVSTSIMTSVMSIASIKKTCLFLDGSLLYVATNNSNFFNDLAGTGRSAVTCDPTQNFYIIIAAQPQSITDGFCLGALTISK